MLKKFIVLTNKSEHLHGTSPYETVLLNTAHIASIKPIKIVKQEMTILGHWIRMVNGKKYKAVQIPLDIEELLADEASISKFKIDQDNYEESAPMS